MNEDIKMIRTYLKQKLLDNILVDYQNESDRLYDLLQRTLNYGESNSALILGPRRCGKTMLVEHVLKRLKSNENFSRNCILVSLSGFIHTDDRVALRSITNQMQLDNIVDGKVLGSFAENLTYLLDCLRMGDKHKSRSVIFILEEFDLFCSHHNQTLLYNLFDVSQSSQTPICVLGVTCRLDVIELLEKRVKSRFSHRQFFLFSEDNVEKPDSLNYILKKISHLLIIPENETELALRSSSKQWNKNITNLLKEKKFKNVVKRLTDVDNNEAATKDLLAKVIHLLNDYRLTTDTFQKHLSLTEEDHTEVILRDLTVLEISLIIAMKHHIEVYDSNPMNFEMIYNRFVKFASEHFGMQGFHRVVILKAFEHIQSLELVSVLPNNSKVQKEYQFFKLLVTPKQITEAVRKSVGLPTEVVQWANSSLN